MASVQNDKIGAARQWTAPRLEKLGTMRDVRGGGGLPGESKQTLS